MIGYTLPEIRRLLISLAQRYLPDPQHAWAWSHWRRSTPVPGPPLPLPATRLCLHLTAVAVLGVLAWLAAIAIDRVRYHVPGGFD